MTVRRFLPVAALLVLTATTAPAFAEAPQSNDARRPGEIARERVDSLLHAFDKFVAGLPQYALPEINDHGDIIIRRKTPRPDMPPKKLSESDSTET
jgi:hypothetical protein